MLFQIRQFLQQCVGCLLKQAAENILVDHADRNAVYEERIQGESHTVDGRLNLREIVLVSIPVHGNTYDVWINE